MSITIKDFKFVMRILRYLNNINILFLLGVFLGLGLIFYEILTLNASNISLGKKKAVAIVNDTIISEDQFLKYVTNLGASIEIDDDTEILDLLLERMIEEELLVQRGIELNLHRKDIGVRKEMIKQVIDFIIQVENKTPSEDEIRQFYNINQGKYVPTQNIYFDAIYIKSKNQESVLLGTTSDQKTLNQKFIKIFKEIETTNFAKAKDIYDENEFYQIPRELTNIKNCYQYFGKQICNDLSEMDLGSVSEPIFFDKGYFIFILYDIEKAIIDDDFFNRIKERVVFDYNNQIDDDKLKDYLEYLKVNSDIKRYSFQ